jgi:redox-sensitive bicupin YhaK (pirin superfamily)
MSGPVSTEDAGSDNPGAGPGMAAIEVTPSRQARVGDFTVRRALPQRGRRTVGAWCFVDHMGPASVPADRGLGVAPHPHLGLQTVTWLLAGEALHRDSLGSEQVIRPGQLNLMTAGHGIAHSEEGTGHGTREIHGVQLWIAQPSSTRDGPAAFEHHSDLPVVDLEGATATVLLGESAGARSPARRDTDHVGLDLEIHDRTAAVPLRQDYEYGLVVLSGTLEVDGRVVEPGSLAYLGTGRAECRLVTSGPARALLIGGVPFDETVLMWWNFVARTREEINDAYRQWSSSDSRFGPVASALARIETGPPPWLRPAP